MKLATAALLIASSVPTAAFAQNALQPTQMLVTVDGKSAPPDASTFTVEVNGRKGPLETWDRLAPRDTQVALLLDDGLRQSIVREMENIRTFVRTLPEGVEVMIGFMQYGHVVAAQGFTTDHERAAAAVHLPQGTPGASASPYVCLSEFVKNWPGVETASSSGNAASQHKGRLVLMISNGVDPYNGSTSIMNQDSPYVKTAVLDAQRAGVAVSAIYFGDADINGTSANDSGQNYLSQIATNTGGASYWQGMGSPASLEPYLKEFQESLAQTYVAGFLAPPGRDPHDLVRVKISAPHVKLHGSSNVLPGNRE
jgi:hypothetical protein